MAKKRDISGFEDPLDDAVSMGKNHLLAIGIDDYQHFDKLNNAVKDVEDISALLTEQFGFEKSAPCTTILLNEMATRRNIIRQLNKLCEVVNPEDRVLIFYSGHGYLNPKTDLGYWIPIEAERGFTADYIANSSVRDLIKAIDCRHILLISDSCFSGELLVRDVSHDGGGVYSQWEKNPSRWIFCSGKGVVADGEKGTNSPFAKQLMKHLSNSTKDKININYLADSVIRSVRYNYDQQAEACPLYGAGHDGGQFIFYRKDTKIKNVDAAFEKAKASRDRDVLISFLVSSNNLEQKQIISRILNDLEKDEQKTIEEPIHGIPTQELSVDELKELIQSAVASQKKEEKAPKSNFPIPKEIGEEVEYTDPRDGEVYSLQRLKDGRVWMVSNLSYDTGKGCWAYDNEEDNEFLYGKLYTLEAAKKACPPGFRIPTKEEWATMAKHYGGANPDSKDKGNAAFKALINGGDSGFNASLGGYRFPDGSFKDKDRIGNYWTSSMQSPIHPWHYFFIGTSQRLDRRIQGNDTAYSVRCILDESK